MLKPVVEVFDELVPANICVVIVFDADGILPKPPGQVAKLRMVDHRLIMDFRSHLALIAANGVPIQIFRSDFKDFTTRRVTDTGNALAVDFHVPTH